MFALCVLFKSETVMLAIVRLSVDRMSSETGETMTGHCARDNRYTRVLTD
jgi:hypothetical protein